MLVLPIDPDNPSGSFVVALDGADYRIETTYLRRLNCWTMAIYTAQDEPICVGDRVVPNATLFERITDPRMPPGRFVVLDERDEPAAPSLGELGTDVKVLYFEASELS